jgi:hypothetical protein
LVNAIFGDEIGQTHKYTVGGEEGVGKITGVEVLSV